MTGTGLVHAMVTGWTPGGAGIWVLILLLLGMWWKGLPSFIDAVANRQSKIEERMGKLLEDATARFARQIADADARHEECIQGQARLVERINVLEEGRRQDQDEIASLRRTIVQNQISAIRIEGQGVPPMVRATIAALEGAASPEPKE